MASVPKAPAAAAAQSVAPEASPAATAADVRPTRSKRLTPRVGWRRAFTRVSVGVPQGPLGQLAALGMGTGHRPLYALMATLLDLRPDDDLLDVGCGSAGLLKYQGAHVRYVAGLDASRIQVAMARRRLADRIAAGTAEIVMADAAALPWQDGRFSVVTSVFCLQFCPDPQPALREIYRVLRPGGRAALTLGVPLRATDVSGTPDEWGYWRWSDAEARRMMEEVGFADVTISRFPFSGASRLYTLLDRVYRLLRIPDAQLARGVKRRQSPRA